MANWDMANEEMAKDFKLVSIYLLTLKDKVPGTENEHGRPDASLQRTGKLFGGLILVENTVQ